jgi:hypothetical protein
MAQLTPHLDRKAGSSRSQPSVRQTAKTVALTVFVSAAALVVSLLAMGRGAAFVTPPGEAESEPAASTPSPGSAELRTVAAFLIDVSPVALTKAGGWLHLFIPVIALALAPASRASALRALKRRNKPGRCLTANARRVSPSRDIPRKDAGTSRAIAANDYSSARLD